MGGASRHGCAESSHYEACEGSHQVANDGRTSRDRQGVARHGEQGHGSAAIDQQTRLVGFDGGVAGRAKEITLGGKGRGVLHREVGDRHLVLEALRFDLLLHFVVVLVDPVWRARAEKPSTRLLTKMSESVRRKEVKSGEFELFFELVAGAGRVRSNLNP